MNKKESGNEHVTFEEILSSDLSRSDQYNGSYVANEIHNLPDTGSSCELCSHRTKDYQESCELELDKKEEIIPTHSSAERQRYLKGVRKRKKLILTTQILILVLAIATWEIAAVTGAIDSFIVSSPTRIWNTILNFRQNQLPFHIGITFLETMIGFVLGAIIGVLIAFVLWWSSFLARVMDPYLVVINALPKIALGPVIIIWVGAGMQAVIVMALAISLVVTIMEMLSGFINTDAEALKMARTFHASKLQTFTKIVFPHNLHTLFNCLKINIGLALVGVIAGEFLVSRAGLGYLIIYGGQVFQMDLVMTSVIILAILAALLYGMVVITQRVVMKMFLK